MIEIYLLEYLLTFYEEGSLLKASERLFISQPSLSRGMQKLESELGVSLFDRTGNSITLNDNGLEILEYARDILSLEHRLIKKADEIKIRKSSINVGMTAQGPMFKYNNFFFNNPEGKTVITTIEDENTLIRQVKNGTLDMAFINNKIEDNELSIKYVMNETLYLSVPKTHFLAGLENDGIYFKDADGQSFLVAEKLGIWEMILEKHFKNSRLFRQNIDNLNEIVNSSTIPSFVTNITSSNRENDDRVFIKFLDDEASVNFYVITRNKNKKMLNELE